MKMNPGTRPARSSRFDRSPDNGPWDGTAQIVAPAPARAEAEPGPGGSAGGPGHPDISPRFRRSFAGHPEQVAQARHFVTAALAGCPAAPDAELLASELATNAVQHSASGHGGSFVVAISHAPGRVRVTVTDGGSATCPAVHVAGSADELELSGRGLLLVDVLADRWGYTGELEHPDGPAPSGAVWFELACT
jgi:anti-sigma regulatory factor (Ser/Thr protein kinase)